MVICEPSNNIITFGHKGKAQISIKTHGVSAHGSAPEKGVNAIYEMAEIIQRVDKTNLELMKKVKEMSKDKDPKKRIIAQIAKNLLGDRDKREDTSSIDLVNVLTDPQVLQEVKK